MVKPPKRKNHIPLTKLVKFARDIRTAMWFRPSVCSLLAAMVALVIAGIDQSIPESTARLLPVIDSEAAKDLLRLVAAGMLTVTTVTLSVTMLVLNLTASQASPRAVPELMADPVTQNALSTFLATFVFAVAALGLFGFKAVSGTGVTLIFAVSVFLGAWAIRYLVQWMHHVAASSKLSSIIVKIYNQAENCLGNYLSADTRESGDFPALNDGDGEIIRAGETGYVQLVNIETLTQSAETLGLVVKLHVSEGDFAHAATTLMTAWGAKSADREAQARLCRSIAIGSERTPEDDPRLGIEILAEIGCRALSPGLNDPQTAIICINYLSALLTHAGRVPKEEYPASQVKGGRVERVVVSFEQLLIRAFRPLVRDGGGQTEVIERILEVLAEMSRTVSIDHLDALSNEADHAAEMACSKLPLAADKESITQAAKAVSATIRARR
ncbi:MAG TPA: hypothetical protein DC046_06950 [Rhodospirillaceae bacterium]|nr:hypothetical protein [Rhodospirillaceae bacterium]